MARHQCRKRRPSAEILVVANVADKEQFHTSHKVLIYNAKHSANEFDFEDNLAAPRSFNSLTPTIAIWVER